MEWIKKLLLLLATVFFAMTVTFVIIRVMPGDPVETMAMTMVREQGIDYDSAYRQSQAMLNFDPDKPIIDQYKDYLSDLSRGDLGISMVYRAPVTSLVFAALPWTLFIFSSALFLSFIIGVLIGMYITWRRQTWLDPALAIYSSVTGSIPSYILAFIFIMIFSVRLRVLPGRGAYDSAIPPGLNMAYIGSVLLHAILPVFSNVVASLGMWGLSMKASAMSILGEDYITAARVRGLPNRRIITSYVGRNAMLPLVTQLAISFAMIFGGSPLIENMFLYPGVGYFLNQAIARRDYLLMQGMFLIITVAVVSANLLAEVLYSVLDPRLRTEG
ncbi:MAG: ABC transporter permease [Chloroflexi bacterium]|nr:ABC transporter permease [Chloroflexota bacterium]